MGARAERVVKALVHRSVLCRLQGDGLDGKRLQDRARAKANLDYEDYQGFETQMAHGLVASVFSDYSGDIGTSMTSPASRASSVTSPIRRRQESPARLPILATPTGSASQGRPNMSKLRSSSSSGWRSPQTKRRSLVPLAEERHKYLPAAVQPWRPSLLASSGKVPGAADLVNLVENHGRAVFPAGAPPWYPNFSNAVYTNLHSAAAGQESVAGAISAIASE